MAVNDSGLANDKPLVLDGFRITNANAEGAMAGPDSVGAGIVCDTSDLMVENCIVHGNVGSSFQLGGGIYAWDQGNRVFRCRLSEIHDNHADWGSGLGIEQGLALVSHADVHDNGSIDPDPTIPDSERAGGIYVGVEAELWISNSEIHDNLAEAGGAAWVDLNAIGSHWTNCTIAFNDRFGPPGGPGGIVFEDRGTGVPRHFIENTIAFFNDVQDVLVTFPLGGLSGEVTAAFSDVGVFSPGLVATGPVLSVDPKFISGARRDFKLRFDPFDLSPCIDAGSDFLMGADYNDVDDDGDPTYPVPLDLTLGPREIANAALPPASDPGVDGGGMDPPSGDGDSTSTDVIGAIVDIGAHEAPTGIAGPPQ